MKNVITICLVLLLFLAGTGYAGLIGSWEVGDPANWYDVKSGVTVGTEPLDAVTTYAYDTTVGVTEGSQSLAMTTMNYNNSLQYKAAGAVGKQEFLDNHIFSIDVTIAADELGVGGFFAIPKVIINAGDGTGGYHQITTGFANLGFAPGSAEKSATLEVDYTSALDLIETNLGDTLPTFIHIIFVTNGNRFEADGVTKAPVTAYFDNAQLIPEPATLCLLGLGGLLLRRKK